MVRPRWPLRILLPLGDAVVAWLGLGVGRLLWNALSPAAGAGGAPLQALGVLLTSPWMPPGLVVLALWIFSLWVEGFYDPIRMISSVRIARATSRAAVVVLVGAIIFQFFTAHRVYSRLMLLASVVSTAALLVGWRLALFHAQSWFSWGWVAKEGVLVVGTGAEASLVAERLERHGSHLYELRGFLTAGGETPAVSRVLGGLDDLRDAVNRTDARLVVLASRTLTRNQALALATAAGHMGLEVLQVPFTFGLVSARLESAPLGELELVRVGGLAYPSAAETVKRVFDLTLIIVGGLLLLPLLVCTAVAIKLSDGGPILYSSKRSGRGGRSFDFYKFRSMVVDADKARHQLPNHADGPLFKMDPDPRVTRVGAFMRRWSIDELPQLLNVLRGDMNLVGPRPLPMSDLEGIEEDPEHWFWFEQRSRVKPGITGLWQVEGRSDLPFRAMVDLDVRYIQNWTLFLDLQVLLKTVPAVLRGRGAR